jgi:hypothetical protein
MTRQVLLFFPEDVTDASAPALMAPEYAFIVDDTEADRVGVSLLLAADPPGDSPDGSSPRHSECLWLSRQTENSRRVWEGELSNGAAGRLLRRPIFALVDGNPIYGQVTSYAGLEVTFAIIPKAPSFRFRRWKKSHHSLCFCSTSHRY